jgi:hypothetical protein
MVQDNESYILYPANYPEHKIRRIHAKNYVSHHAFMYKNEASSSRHYTHVKMPKRKSPTASNESNILKVALRGVNRANLKFINLSTTTSREQIKSETR